RVAEWSKAPDSSSGPLTRAWVQIPLLTTFFFFQMVLRPTTKLHLIIYTLQSLS
ncbi:hypothetical protein LINPERHAP2_LOCUS24538, partial [Linum perenne]